MKYLFSKSNPLRVNEMPTVSATRLKNETADVFDEMTASGALAITRHDKPRAVLMTMDQYVSLIGEELPGLDALKEEYQKMLEEMQSPEQKGAARRLFEATPEELGEAAVRAAKLAKKAKE